jgi:hypothetical protein
MDSNPPLVRHDVTESATHTEMSLSNSKPQSQPNNDLEHEQGTVSRPQPVLEQEAILQSSASTVVASDIEHVAVTDDPRLWPRKRKVRLP